MIGFFNCWEVEQLYDSNYTCVLTYSGEKIDDNELDKLKYIIKIVQDREGIIFIDEKVIDENGDRGNELYSWLIKTNVKYKIIDLWNAEVNYDALRDIKYMFLTTYFNGNNGDNENNLPLTKSNFDTTTFNNVSEQELKEKFYNRYKMFYCYLDTIKQK